MSKTPNSREHTYILQAQNGDADAFGRLVQTYEDAVYRYCYRRLGNHEDALDTCQQIFLAAWQSLPRFNAGKAFAPWLYTLAHRKCVDQYRVRERNGLLEPAPAEVEERDPSVWLSQRENGEYLWGWVAARLPSTMFTAFWMQVEQDYSIREIAEKLGKSQTHVKVMLLRARRRLAAALKEKAPESLAANSARWAGLERMIS